MLNSINIAFENAKKEKRPALLTYIVAGDNTKKKSLEMLISIAKYADILELGIPHNALVADGNQIQTSAYRAIENGIKVKDIFEIVKKFKKNKNSKPIILMGYYNMIYQNGENNFLSKCKKAGVDGLIVVDLQPEEDSELYIKTKEKEIDLIRLITPTTNEDRLNTILQNASGFLYYVTITGITGQNSANLEHLKESIKIIKSHTKLPVIAGFGIKNRKDVKEISSFTDGVVVGSSIVNIIKNNLNDKNKLITEIDLFTKDLKKGII